mmetsp:Transcript_10872/g.28574  ORF Transcript_10872/g.28574 Transcript_10872/m.28574 type:complete len:99 (-) Transcript_10872:153-449(-)
MSLKPSYGEIISGGSLESGFGCMTQFASGTSARQRRVRRWRARKGAPYATTFTGMPQRRASGNLGVRNITVGGAEVCERIGEVGGDEALIKDGGEEEK